MGPSIEKKNIKKTNNYRRIKRYIYEKLIKKPGVRSV